MDVRAKLHEEFAFMSVSGSHLLRQTVRDIHLEVQGGLNCWRKVYVNFVAQGSKEGSVDDGTGDCRRV